MLEELRWLEYGQRLRGERRGVFRGDGGHVAAALLNAGTVNGGGSLGVMAGQIAPGYWCDLVGINLKSPILSGWSPETLLDSIIFGGGNEMIACVCVGGHWHHFPRLPEVGVH
jgi:formimidoylglutamate deiminase